jgi:hypothetical protein
LLLLLQTNPASRWSPANTHWFQAGWWLIVDNSGLILWANLLLVHFHQVCIHRLFILYIHM